MKNIFILILFILPTLVFGQHIHSHETHTHSNVKDTITTVKTAAGLTIEPIEGPVPWTSLELNNDPDNFQFAIVTDRTGGHREGVFLDAVNKLNLLQPEFVMSVGDLIEGYTTDMDELNRQWDEFDGFVKQLEMPFFYLPGNHDITNQVMEDLWKKRLGPTYFHFVYRDVLFLALNSEDQKQGAGRGTISEEQFLYTKKVLAENPNVKWTLLFMHQPLWNQNKTKYWNDIEKLLSERKHTVFTGHEHRYVKYKRNNSNYYVLATTGGGSGLRGPSMGEFDHVVWVTMTKNGPVLANLLLEGIWDENVFTEETRSFVDSMSAKSPFSIVPIYLEDNTFNKGLVTIKISNDENISMHVEFDERSSKDLIVMVDSNSVVIPPNSVGFVNLSLLKRNNSFNNPVSITATVRYYFNSVKNKLNKQKANIKIPYSFNIAPLPKLNLNKINREIKIDGNANDWGEFPYSFEAENGDMKAKFDFCRDDSFVYFAAYVEDDTIVSLGEGAAWIQDNVGFGFNALPMSQSAMSVGRHWYKNEFYQLMTPQTKEKESVKYRDFIEGAEMKCVLTKNGYFAEAKVPISYIEERQGKNWKTIRLVVVVDDKDGDNINRYWWYPNWRNKEKNVIGSGMFFR